MKAVRFENERMSFHIIRQDWKTVALYSKKEQVVSVIYILISTIIVFMTALDSLEAAFAQTELGLTETTYGLLVSVAGLGFLVASFLNMKWPYSPLLSIKYGAVFIALGYLIYAVSNQFLPAAIGCFLLTFAHCYVNIGFVTYVQRHIPTELLGRFTSVFGLFESLCSFLLVMAFGLAVEQIGLRAGVLAGSFVLLGIGLYLSILIHQKRKGFIISK